MQAQFEETHPGPIHGGLNARELESLGLCPEEVLDFSASINPLGAGPGVKAALRSLPPDAYPDRTCLKRYKICVRDCGSFGLPEHIRVGVRNIEDSQRLVRALKQAAAAISGSHE